MSLIAERRFARWPGAVNAVVLGVILVLVTILGVRVAQAPPPQIAAFAPELQQQNRNALSGTLAGPGGAAPSGVAATPTPTPTPRPTPAGSSAPIVTPAVRQCYGNPPRQTPDPQSPPCVPYYDPSANNGGSTSMGVTKNTIYVAWPDLGYGFGSAIETEADIPDFATYFTNHFEFYGRHIQLVPYRQANAAFAKPSPSQMQSDATAVANSNPGIGLFASLEYEPNGGAAYYYYNQLAQDGIVSVDSDVMVQDDNEAYGPYEWSTVPSTEGFMTNLGGLVCNDLKNGGQQFAGAPPPNSAWGAKRTFRIVVGPANIGLTWDDQPLATALSQCGLDGTTIDHINSPGTSDSPEAVRLSTNKCANGITTCPISTVLCVCSGGELAQLMSDSQQQGYFPEWVVSGTGAENQDSQSSSGGNDVGTAGYPASQLSHIIGITYDNKIDPPANEFWYSALREVDSMYKYHDNATDYWDYFRYEQFMVLAAGIQAAGPDLTPQSFANGLYSLHFPNPGAGQAPYYQARVGFSPSNHHWFEDAAALWYDAQATNYTTNEPRTGSFCYSRGGQRSATWTDIAPTFYENQSCR